MADLQAEIELTVELRKFINIDLFVQGYFTCARFCLFIFIFTCFLVIIKFVQELNLHREFNRQRKLKLNPNFLLRLVRFLLIGKKSLKFIVVVVWNLDDSSDSIYPACVFNDWGVSKTFLIIFKNEEVQLDDQFNFKLSVIVDAQTVNKLFRKVRPSDV